VEFMIFDRSGSAVASFSDELLARATAHAIVAVEPEAADDLVLLAYDDDGMPAGEPVSYWEIPPPVRVAPSDFVYGVLTAALAPRVSRIRSRYVGEPAAVRVATPAPV
jgi:hypothetical protein